MPITYFYALPDGQIKENRDNLPADSVGAVSRQDGLVLRVAYDSDANRVHLQDGFFRRLLGDGDQADDQSYDGLPACSLQDQR